MPSLTSIHMYTHMSPHMSTEWSLKGCVQMLLHDYILAVGANNRNITVVTHASSQYKCPSYNLVSVEGHRWSWFTQNIIPALTQNLEVLPIHRFLCSFAHTAGFQPKENWADNEKIIVDPPRDAHQYVSTV